MRNVARLVLRLVLGSLMAGHGLQKLTGAFNGPGLKGTQGFMEAIGITPGKVWGPVVAIGETSGGLLTLLGFLNPIGPLNIMAAMATAMHRVHRPNGLWNSNGGIEFPLTNFTAALALVMVGPGKLSLDGLFGIHLPKWMQTMAWINTGVFAAFAMLGPSGIQSILDRMTGNSRAYEGAGNSESHPGINTVTQ